MRSVAFTLSAGAVLLSGLPAFAAPGDPIGSAVLVVNQVTAELSRDVRTLQMGDRVRHSELIEAGSDARTELQLDDQTKLALGPGSRLMLDKFVYDPDKDGGSIFLNLAKGTFRFLTGVAAKPAYTIRTPVAAITVRGTIFDLFVMLSGETWLMLSEGGVKACNARGKCRVVDKPGQIIRIAEDGEIGVPGCWSRLGAAPGFAFEEAFPFVVSPPTVDEKPIFTRAVLTGDSVCATLPKKRKAKKKSKPVKKAVKKKRWKPKVRVVKVRKPKVVIRPKIKIHFSTGRRNPDYGGGHKHPRGVNRLRGIGLY